MWQLPVTVTMTGMRGDVMHHACAHVHTSHKHVVVSVHCYLVLSCCLVWSRFDHQTARWVDMHIGILRAVWRLWPAGLEHQC